MPSQHNSCQHERDDDNNDVCKQQRRQDNIDDDVNNVDDDDDDDDVDKQAHRHHVGNPGPDAHPHGGAVTAKALGGRQHAGRLQTAPPP